MGIDGAVRFVAAFEVVHVACAGLHGGSTSHVQLAFRVAEVVLVTTICVRARASRFEILTVVLHIGLLFAVSANSVGGTNELVILRR